LILGGLALQSSQSTYLDPAFRLSLLVVAHVVIFTVLIWWDVTFIYRLDVERRRAEEGLRRYADRLHNLLEIGRAIISSQGADETAQTTLDRLRRQLSCPWSAVLLFDAANSEARVLAVEADLPHSEAVEAAVVRAKGLPFNAGAYVPLQLIPPVHMVELEKGEIVATANQPSRPDEAITDLVAGASSNGSRASAAIGQGSPQTCNLVDSLSQCELGNAIIVPLRARNALLGCVLLARPESVPFEAEAYSIASEVSDRLSLVIQQWSLFEQLSTNRTQLQILSHRLMEAQEIERRALARELHDEIGQELTAIRLNLQTVQKLLDTDIKDKQQLKSFLNEGISIAETVLQQVRNMSLDLRPSLLDDLGLVAALRWYADRQAQRARMP
jgi:signal transduction histidine kinase